MTKYKIDFFDFKGDKTYNTREAAIDDLVAAGFGTRDDDGEFTFHDALTDLVSVAVVPVV